MRDFFYDVFWPAAFVVIAVLGTLELLRGILYLINSWALIAYQFITDYRILMVSIIGVAMILWGIYEFIQSKIQTKVMDAVLADQQKRK